MSETRTYNRKPVTAKSILDKPAFELSDATEPVDLREMEIVTNVVSRVLLNHASMAPALLMGLRALLADEDEG